MNDNKKARKALKRMAQVVKNDMLVKEEYISENVVNEKLKEEGAVCGGHQACAIGSLWLGYGIQPDFDSYGTFHLPGAMETGSYGGLDRDEFLAENPALKLAYDALNEAADRFMDAHPATRANRSVAYTASIEQLFEGCYDDGNPWGEDHNIGRDEMLSIIKDARRSLKVVEEAA